MGKSNIELMKSARESLTGQWGLAIITFLIYHLIIGVVQSREDLLPYTTIIFLIFAGPLAVGISIFSLNLSRNSEARFEQLFDGFKTNIGNSILAYFLMILFVMLWMLLLIIPGIIAAISYSMLFFIIAEDEHIGPMDALDKSKKMMYGYKWKYFRLGLRLFGLALLCILTLGIGFLWLIPFAHVTNAKFYEDIKANPITIE